MLAARHDLRGTLRNKFRDSQPGKRDGCLNRAHRTRWTIESIDGVCLDCRNAVLFCCAAVISNRDLCQGFRLDPGPESL